MLYSTSKTSLLSSQQIDETFKTKISSFSVGVGGVGGGGGGMMVEFGDLSMIFFTQRCFKIFHFTLKQDPMLDRAVS